MERIPLSPRPDWRAEVERYGLTFHTAPEGAVYWNEAAYYAFTEAEIDRLESATEELHRLCLTLVGELIESGRLGELGIPERAHPLLAESWLRREPSLYGRFDLSWPGGDAPLKLLEYNADTPTSLLEAAVVQWKWLEARFPEADQFNSIWEGLVERWRILRAERRLRGTVIHFGHEETPEDEMTVVCLQDTAAEAGLLTERLAMAEIGWNEDVGRFTDLGDQPIRTLFKLYPWEWMWDDGFWPQVARSGAEMQWIEPAWKAALSNKGFLALLWERFPDHELLLETRREAPADEEAWVRKPFLSREGANVRLPGQEPTPGPYAGPYVWQRYAPLPEFDGHRPVIGAWVVGDTARGIGIRESDGPVTDDLSRFVPHLFR